MAVPALGALTVSLGAAAIVPALAEERLEFPLPPQERSQMTMSVGSIGPDTHPASSNLPAPGEDPYHSFLIPSQRPPEKVPGFQFRIPLGGNDSH
jgi:hypothetical protein